MGFIVNFLPNDKDIDNRNFKLKVKTLLQITNHTEIYLKGSDIKYQKKAKRMFLEK